MALSSVHDGTRPQRIGFSMLRSSLRTITGTYCERRNVIARRKGEITLDFKEALSSGLERGANSPYIDFMQLLQGGDRNRRSVGVGPELLTYSLLVMLRKKSEKNRGQAE